MGVGLWGLLWGLCWCGADVFGEGGHVWMVCVCEEAFHLQKGGGFGVKTVLRVVGTGGGGGVGGGGWADGGSGD